MTIEDLKILKDYCEMRKEWQLLELVNAEIKRQNVTDEDVQGAIDFINGWRDAVRSMGGEAIDTKEMDDAINALQRIINPIEVPDQLLKMFSLSEDVQISNKMFQFCITREDANIVYQSLQQMRKEPCKCEIGENIKNLDSCEGMSLLKPQIYYCPNCGRKL